MTDDNVLGAGIPYNVSIWAVNLAGPGHAVTLTTFTMELGKLNIAQQSNLSIVMPQPAPQTAPRNFRAVHLTGSSMELFWVPLTLSEAQGFVTTYTVSYRQLTSSSESEVEETAIRHNGTVVAGLQEDATYLVQVWASTTAGPGERSPVIVVQAFMGTPNGGSGTANGSSDTGAIVGGIVGGIVAVLLIVAATIVAVSIVVAVTIKGKQQGQSTK